MLKRIPLLLVVPGFFISVAILASVFSRQPSYLGRSLTEWIEVYIRAQGPTMFHNDEVRKNEIVAAEAATAVRQIGTNGIGTLLRLVPSRRGYPVAYCGFQILGSSARAAAPSLIALTTNSDREIRDRALSCLLEVRAEEKVLVPSLVTLLSDSDKNIRFQAAIGLCDFPEEAEKAGVYKIFPQLRNEPASVIESKFHFP